MQIFNPKHLIVMLFVAIWTLVCIYGTYWNTIKHAELISVTENEYEILYGNTGEIYTYK